MNLNKYIFWKYGKEFLKNSFSPEKSSENSRYIYNTQFLFRNSYYYSHLIVKIEFLEGNNN